MSSPFAAIRAAVMVLGIGLGLACWSAGQAQQRVETRPYNITISEDKTEVAETFLPVDPAIRVEYQYTGSMNFGVTGEGKRLTCGPGAAFSMFKIDEQVVFPNNAVQSELPIGPAKKKRHGMQASCRHGDIKITMMLEVVPGRPVLKNAGEPQKRRMDALLIKYVLENAGNQPHKVAARMLIDTMCGNNDGAIFASPVAHPGRLIDGEEFKGKDIPEFVEILEMPDLKNPGFKGVFTFKLGSKVEGPDRTVFTNLGASGPWDVRPVMAMGDSAVAFFWDSKEIKPGGKREIAFAYGQGVACNPENEGKVNLALGGNFEPNKVFTVTAYVNDPLEGQNLSLELPKGVERIDGKDVQAVPQPADDSDNSVVLWRCRVLEPGSFPIRVRSSNGITQTRTVTVARPD